MENVNENEVSNSVTTIVDVPDQKYECLTYGQALENVKNGQLISRRGWNGKDMFVFMRPGDELTADMIINTVRSLPLSVKHYFSNQFAHTAKEESNGKSPKDVKIKFLPYLCMKAADGSIVNGWLASQTDMLANDWFVYKS